MYRDEYLREAFIEGEEQEKWLLKYYLRVYLVNEGEEMYGLRVDKFDENGALIETEATSAVTESHKTAQSLVDAFARGTVPPCVLMEMVDEWAS